MKENSIFFERILQVIDYYGIKSVNSFACEHLNYDSSEKINRLKKETAKPSFEILCDIANKFEDIDMNWLLTGKGSMLKSKKKCDESAKATIPIVDNTSMGFILDRYDGLVAENALLKKEVEDLKLSRGKSIDPIPYSAPTSSLTIAAEPKHK